MGVAWWRPISRCPHAEPSSGGSGLPCNSQAVGEVALAADLITVSKPLEALVPPLKSASKPLGALVSLPPIPYWSFKSYDDITTSGSSSGEGLYHTDGSIQSGKLAVLTRPYAPSIAGRPLSWHFDTTSQTFTLRYKCVENVYGPTIIVAYRRLHYPRGANVIITPRQAAHWEAVGDVLQVTHDASAAHDGLEIEVVVHPAA